MMAEPIDPVHELGEILAKVDARPVLVRERLAVSTLYDAEYHVAILACVFAACSKTEQGRQRQILAPWLKLLQFVALRPHLVDDLRTWSSSRRDADLLAWSKMPRGFIGDRTHDAVVDFLVAAGVLEQSGDYVIEGRRVAVLDTLVDQIKSADLFASERRVIAMLSEIKPNKTMLGGA